MCCLQVPVDSNSIAYARTPAQVLRSLLLACLEVRQAVAKLACWSLCASINMTRRIDGALVDMML